MKKFVILFLAMCFVVALSAGVFASEMRGNVPEKVHKDHWSCRDINELSAKYGALKKIPEKDFIDRKELAESLLAVLLKVVEKCELEGPAAVSKEDLERIAALHEALKEELAQYEGYATRRESIEKILSPPETPPFLYKVGVNGFLRPEAAGNFHLVDNSYTPRHGEGRFVYRIKPYAYWHPTEWIDIHAEGQGYGYIGGNHQEFSRYSLYQGFVEVKLPERDWIALKGGRQEFSYGSTFIIGPDAFYDGRVFDAGRLRVKPLDKLAIDLLGGVYATPFSSGVKGSLLGTYATYTLSEGNTVEAYAFRDTGTIERHSGEHLDTWGMRGTAKVGPVTVELEPVYESGRIFDPATGFNEGINSFGGHLDGGVEAVLGGYNNKFIASFAYGSGSRGAATGAGAGREFRIPNNNTSLVGDMNVIGDLAGINVNGHHASGLQIYTLGWGIDITKEVNLSATGHYSVANKTEPGLRRPLGLETDLTLTWNIMDGLSVIAGYDRFFTGGFFRDASGSNRDIDYVYMMLQFDIFHSKPRLKLAKG